MNMVNRTLAEHAAALDAREYSSVELTQAYLAEIEAKDAQVGAYLTVDAEGALALARLSDERRAKGSLLGRLDGIPFAVKDNFCTEGLRTTCASGMLEHYVPPFDATAVARLKAAGAVLLGKLNMDEFAMGSSGENSALRLTRNPCALDRVAGGSSCGSAAAVASHQAAFALGSDTGGSIRQPAAFCGVVGFKPTYGAISRSGLIAMASSLDSVGVLSGTCADARLVFDMIAGRDEKDFTSFDLPENERTIDSLKGLTVGLVRDLCTDEAVSDEVRASVESAAEAFRAWGATVKEVSLPSPDAALAAYCVLSAAESSSNLARYDGIAYGYRAKQDGDVASLYSASRGEGFGVEVKRRILFGGYMLSEEKRGLYYERACFARAALKQQTDALFETCDLLLMPSSPTTAFPCGTKWSAAEQRRADLCAVYASLAGLPAVSIPFGRDRDGLPIGIQLSARGSQDRFLLRAAELLGEASV